MVVYCTSVHEESVKMNSSGSYRHNKGSLQVFYNATLDKQDYVVHED